MPVSSPHKLRSTSEPSFTYSLLAFTGLYGILILALIFAVSHYVTWDAIMSAAESSEIQSSVALTFWTCTLSALLATTFAVPIAYFLSRFSFRGRTLLDTLLDVPIILPPLVVGLALLILFNAIPSREHSLESWLGTLGFQITYNVPAIILAQFTIATAFAIRSLKNSFDQISSRPEDIALTLGASRFQAFRMITLPQAKRGVLSAGLMAWSRSLGEFGPILVFAGATRGRTEVLSTSVYLELNIGNLGGATAVSLILITLAITCILCVRIIGDRN